MIRRALLRIDVGSWPLLLVPLISAFPLRNNDLWWHLAAGRWMVENRSFPGLDPFSHTVFMAHWVDNEWLAELVFYGAWNVWGNTGLILLRALLLTTVFMLLRAYLRSARRPSMTLSAMVVGVALSYSWWTLRPSVFSLIGVLALMTLLERFRHGRRESWLLPCLFLVWANVHPGFFFGLLVLAATVAALWVEPLLPGIRRFSSDRGLRVRLTAWCAASFAATLVNPYGARVFSQQFVIMQNVRYRELLDEWAPPSVPFLLLVLAAVGAFLLLRFRRVPLPSLVPILGAAAMSTTAVRFEEYFALVAVPAMLVYLGRLRGRTTWFLGGLVTGSLLVGLLPPMGSAIREGGQALGQLDSVDGRVLVRSRRNVALLAGVAAASLAVARIGRPGFLARVRSVWRSGRFAPAFALTGIVLTALSLLVWPFPADGVEPERYPDACLAALSDNGRPFNKLSWGGWLIWKRGLQTYIDGRCWGQSIFFEYRRAQSGGALEVFAERRIDAVIVPPFDPIARTVSGARGWEEACRDDVSVVYRLRR